jgi:sensor histidine kinase YesM
MRNPYFQKPIWAGLYIIWWILPSSIHSFVLWKVYNIQLNEAIIDSAISFSILSLIGLSIWYMVRYSNIDNDNKVNIIRMHIIALLTILTIWLAISYGVIGLISNNLIIIFKSTVFWRILLFLPVYLLLIFSYFLFSSTQQIIDQDVYKSEMEKQIRSAELNMLKAQINPHFLFNSLNSASALTISDPNKAQEMIINISDFFRYTLVSAKNQFTTLEKEIEQSLLYLEIEKARFGDKIIINCNLPEEYYHIKIPSLILQPLVENAVKHGVYESTKPILIDFKFDIIENKLKLIIDNELDSSSKGSKIGTQTGLQNVKNRLEITYSQKDLMAYTKTDKSFKVTIWIPIEAA